MDERYRWCVYCGADCWPDAEHQEHGDECPAVTGKFPLRHPTAPPGAPAPYSCCRCEKRLTTHYRHVQIAEDGYEVVCDDCALQALVTSHD